MSKEAVKENQDAVESTACHSHTPKGTQMNDQLQGQDYYTGSDFVYPV